MTGRLRPTIWILAAALLAPLAGPAAACSISQFDLTKKEPLPRYSVVLFFEPNTPDGKASMETLNLLGPKWGPRANVDFQYVDVTTEHGKKILRYWPIDKFPVTFILSPSDYALARLEGRLTPDKVEPYMTSPGKAALLQALKKNQAVYLVLGKKGMKGYREMLKAAEDAAKVAKTAMKIDVGTLTINPADPGEVKLIENLRLKAPPKEAQVFVTFGKGRAVLQEVGAENTVDRLAFTIQLLATADQCSLGQEIRGETLLLGK